MVTAADRAAATFAVRGTNPSARLRRAPPLSGEALRGGSPKGSLRRGSCQPKADGGHPSPCPQARLARPRRLCQPPWTQPISRNPRPPCMGAQVRRNIQVYSHPLFGRGGPGGRGASLREAASPPSVPPPTSLRAGARGRGFSTEKPPPPEFFLCISLYFSWLFA